MSVTALTHVYTHILSSLAPEALVWTFVASLFLPRLCAVIGAVYLVRFTKGHHRPTRPGKIFLVTGLLITLVEDLPSSVVTVATNSKKILPFCYNVHFISFSLFYRALSSTRHDNL